MSQSALARTPGSTPIDFGEVFEQQLGYVLRTLRFLGVRAADLEDVAHDVFIHVYRHINDYDPTRPLRPWLYAFAYRTARDHRQLARHRERAFDHDGPTIDSKPHPEAQLIQQQKQELALRALGKSGT
ncbi:MAG: sigma-70 family RNA polymerase sigma factor [Polyangiaceae bacterium]